MHPLFRLKKRAYAHAASSRGAAAARQVIDALAFGVRRLPSEANLAWDSLESQASVRLGRLPSLAAVLNVAGIDIRPLAACYAHPIAQPGGYRGYWHDATAKRTIGIAAGIDFLPTDDGLRFVECNINFAQRAERSSLYESDPYVENLLDFAVEKGYRRLSIVDSGANGIDPATAQRFEKGAQARDLALTLVDRENVPDSKYPCRYGMPPIDTPDTLQVRTRSYPIALDYVADMKRASVRVLERYLENARDAALLLPQSGAEPVLGHVAPDEPFPNVVYKLPEIDQARGVYFLKAESPEHARRILGDAIRSAAGGSLLARLERLAGGRDGIYQAYYKSRMRHDRRLYIVRAHVLITPVGVRLLSAHRVISGRTVPDTLPTGVIADPSPFLVNYSAGSWYEIVPDDEAGSVARAAEAAGRGLAWAFEYGFKVS